MTTTPHHDPAAARWNPAAAGTGTPPAGSPRRPDVGAARLYAHPAVLPDGLPGGRAPVPAAVLATRVVGLTLTFLCALWPALFALMGIAFGLGLEDAGGVVFGAVMGTVAIAWPVGFWFATRGARRVWPVLVALIPTVLVAGGSVSLWLAG
ncbi:hypothetical protein LWC35_01335 [Pseudonocardia kujensis]|uniref:hypothetical protein n=1 Tax=Pseudonocardia kujensis TaxID=1128675 RepID=UPI001E54F0D0|nr:hypothetical protein [Pseudonocardia kujensis]MCE0761565.1 hypothetical protein [Pseudonocardia kujensis]